MTLWKLRRKPEVFLQQIYSIFLLVEEVFPEEAAAIHQPLSLLEFAGIIVHSKESYLSKIFLN